MSDHSILNDPGQSFRLIPLSGTRGRGLFTKVSPHRFDYLNQFKWSLVTKRGYVARTVKSGGKTTLIYIHREIKGFPEGLDVDHKDGDHLNNVDENLRVATRTQNNANQHTIRQRKTSQYKGVCRDWRSGKWLAQISVNGINKRVGLYENEEDAARARDGAAIALHGEFAVLTAPHLEPITYVPPKRQVRTSQYKGVGWSKERSKWRAYRTEGKHMIHLGYFSTELEAYEATQDNNPAVYR